MPGVPKHSTLAVLLAGIVHGSSTVARITGPRSVPSVGMPVTSDYVRMLVTVVTLSVMVTVARVSSGISYGRY